MNDYGKRAGDLYDIHMGPHGEGILGGSIEFKNGSRIHHTVFGEAGGGRFSWDTLPGGGSTQTHFTDIGYPKGDQRRHPFSSD